MPTTRFVVTGGPGSGKSTLLAALEARGFAVAEEAGRAIIREQVAAGGNALPWADREAFAQEMLARDIASYVRFADARSPVFFDRGVPDIAGYLTLCGLDVPVNVSAAISECRYADPVFIAPFWREIYAQDKERKQDPHEAERTYLTMKRVYSELGYTLLELPRENVDGRVEFVLSALRSSPRPC